MTGVFFHIDERAHKTSKVSATSCRCSTHQHFFHGFFFFQRSCSTWHLFHSFSLVWKS